MFHCIHLLHLTEKCICCYLVSTGRVVFYVPGSVEGRHSFLHSESHLITDVALSFPFFLFIYLFIYLFLLFRAAPIAYGGSQTRGLLWSYSCWPAPQPQRRQIPAVSATYSSGQCWILNPLSEARHGTRNLMVPSWIHFHCAMMGTPHLHFKDGKIEAQRRP